MESIKPLMKFENEKNFKDSMNVSSFDEFIENLSGDFQTLYFMSIMITK